MTREEILDMLFIDLSSTMGCTDVGAIGYAAATGSALLKGELCRTELVLSNMLYKNALRVGIPGTFTAGVKRAVLLGYQLKNPHRKLSVFRDATAEHISQLDHLEQSVPIKVTHVKTEDPLHIDLSLYGQENTVRVLMARAYDHVESVHVDGRQVFAADSTIAAELAGSPRPCDTNIDELYAFISTEDEALQPLVELAELNYQTSLLDLPAENTGDANNTDNPGALASKVRRHILSAAGQRMQGAAVPVTGVAGSGNLGIATLTSTLVLAKTLGANQTDTHRALALATLISTYIKRKMSLLTTICGTSLAGGAAVSAAAVFLKGGSLQQIKNAINMLIAINAGTLCDGAKGSCAFKVGFAAENAVVTAEMALAGQALEGENGINKPDVEQTIQNIADINNQSLDAASAKILDII